MRCGGAVCAVSMIAEDQDGTQNVVAEEALPLPSFCCHIVVPSRPLNGVL
jgi:hypothetical protein